MDECENEHLSRVIHTSKYERPSAESYNWWQRLFKMMEHESEIQQFQNVEVVRQIFAKDILDKILGMMSIAQDEAPAIKLSGSDISIASNKTEKTLLTDTTYTGSTANERDQQDLYCHQVVISYDVKPTKAGPKNPYLQFFKRKPERAAVWRELPPLSLEGMNLSQKAEAITEAIAIDFIKWMMNVGGSPTSLDVPQIVKMFEIGFHTHAATSLVSRVKELPAVTKSIAQLRELPQKAIRYKLQKKLQQDIACFNKKKKLLAFGTELPDDLRYVPPRENTAAKFLTIESPEHLKTMSAVWDGITESGCTRGYCKWLIDHPELPAPKYLQNKGMLEPSYHLKQQYSVESQISEGHNAH